MRLNYYGTIKYVRVMAENEGLGVVFHNEEKDFVPHTDGRNIHILRPSAMWDEEKWINWFYTVLHELGHETPLRRNWKSVEEKNKISVKSLYGALWNLFEDYGQEKDQHGVYEGRDEYLSKGRYIFVRYSAEEKKEGVNKYDDAMRACWVWDMFNRESWMPDMVGIGSLAKSNMTTPQLDYLDKLMSSSLDADSLKDCEDTPKFVEDVLRVLGLDPEEEKAASAEAYDKEQAKKGEGEGDDESSGGGANDKEGEEGSPAEASGVFEVDYKEYLPHAHEHVPHYCDIHINYSNKSGMGEYIIRDSQEVDFVKDKIPNSLASFFTRASRYKESLDRLSTGNGLANKVRRLLQVMSQSRWIHSQRKGKLSTKNLYKVNPSINIDSIFKLKNENSILDTSVVVLGDFSGSMSGSKIIHNMKAMSLLNEAIGKLNVPLEILGFTDDEDGPINYIFKSFNSRISNENLTENLLRGANYLANNADGESIMWAYERLAKQRTKRKILIVLSDGSPANAGLGDCYEFTHTVIQEIEKQDFVEIYGIGIMDDNVRHLYKHSSVIHDANQLESELIKVIQEKVLNIRR